MRIPLLSHHLYYWVLFDNLCGANFPIGNIGFSIVECVHNSRPSIQSNYKQFKWSTIWWIDEIKLCQNNYSLHWYCVRFRMKTLSIQTFLSPNRREANYCRPCRQAIVIVQQTEYKCTMQIRWPHDSVYISLESYCVCVCVRERNANEFHSYCGSHYLLARHKNRISCNKNMCTMIRTVFVAFRFLIFRHSEKKCAYYHIHQSTFATVARFRNV